MPLTKLIDNIAVTNLNLQRRNEYFEINIVDELL